MMSTLPHSQFDGNAPEPMHSLTHVVISPANIAMEARLSRAKPLGRWELGKLKRELSRLERQVAALAVGEVEDTQRFIELRESLKVLLDYKLDLAQKRQLLPDDPHLKVQWEQLYEEARPLQQEYEELREQLKKLQALKQNAAAIRQRIDDNPNVIEKLKADNEKNKIQREEARAYEQLMIDRFTQLGYCYRWTDTKGNKRIDEVKFAEIHITSDAVFFKVAASYRAMLGAWKTKIPYGVKIMDLVKEDTLTELSYACQRQVSAKASMTGGAWIIVHRLDTNDGLLNEVRYSEVMKRYPRKYRALIPLCVGVSHHRNVQWLNLAQFPHMLVAGFTNSGKSNLVNSLICTMITEYDPVELRLVLVDLKDGIEFSSYEKIPHLHKKVVDSVAGLADRLHELEAIMQDRNQMMRGKAKTIGEYNVKYIDNKLPRIVCIIDEVASIMAQGDLTKRIMNSLGQLTAKGRAAGIHIILSTQRPSVDVIDGRVKVNLAARLVGRMPSHFDSQTILGSGDAKDLAAIPGRMILQIGPDPIPVQTPFIDEGDILDALKRAMEYPTPEPLPLPESMDIQEEWTPEKIVELSLNFLGGNIGHTVIWKEIKEEGNISSRQLRDMVQRIWAMDCIEYAGKKYKVERGQRSARKLVEVPQPSSLTDSE
jgi:hypothetical protein